jgi:AraC-like DNA-binding protein
MIRRDYGAAVAADASRLSVMPLERAGEQSQFIVHEPPVGDGNSLEPVMQWLEQQLHQPMTLDSIARRAAMSTRTLRRQFSVQMGTTITVGASRTATARENRPSNRTDRGLGWIWISARLSRPVSEDCGHQSSGVPTSVPRIRSDSA